MKKTNNLIQMGNSNRSFTRRKSLVTSIQKDVLNHMSSGNTSKAIKEYYYTLTHRRPIQSDRSHTLARIWSKRNSLSLLVGMQVVQPIWKIVWQFFKTKHPIPYDAAILLLGVIEELKMYVCTKIYTWMYTAALYIIAMLIIMMSDYEYRMSKL